eukprot:GHVQ01022828.1.p1 GENE.GHVQ01022828.1~~GHVQ01022828.1.p1  ORF type:complete len:158 (+),score=14.60 GHVQ01022828.1:30-503(+)
MYLCTVYWLYTYVCIVHCLYIECVKDCLCVCVCIEMKHKIVFGHHPFFVQAVDEPDELGDTFVPFVNKLVPLSHFHIPLARRMPLLNLLERYGVRYSFHGHTHYNKIVRSGSFEQVITTATGVQLGNDKPGYRVVRIYKDGRIDTTEFVTVLPHVEY